MQICKDYGYTSHDNESCGLHIHVSRSFFGADENTQKYNLAKLVWFYQQNFSDLSRASRRTEQQINAYCKSSEYKHPQDITDQLRKNHNQIWDRYHAVNLSNYNTVEFRLGRGTLNYDSFSAWIDLTVTIVRNICNTNWTSLTDTKSILQGLKDTTVSYLVSRGAFQGVM